MSSCVRFRSPNPPTILKSMVSAEDHSLVFRGESAQYKLNLPRGRAEKGLEESKLSIDPGSPTPQERCADPSGTRETFNAA